MKTGILIVDDHTIVRDGLCALLEDHPEICVVGCAANGRQAIELAGKLRPDIILMDISMPGCSGLQAAHEIRAANPNIRIIILSMRGSSEDVFGALKEGIDGYLLKESAGREVIDAVLAVSKGRTYLSQPITNTLIEDYVKLREHNGIKSPLDLLSEREREIMTFVLEGRSSAEIGSILHLSRKTVESYRSRMMQKLGVEDVTGLMRFAAEADLI